MGVKRWLLAVVCFVFALRTLLLAGHEASAQPPAVPRADLAPQGADNLPISFDGAYRLSRFDRARAGLLLLKTMRAPAGREQLVAALRSPDSRVVILAARILACSADFGVIRPLLDCAVKHGGDPDVLKAAVEAVDALMGDSPGIPEPRALQEARHLGFSQLRDYFLNHDTRWRNTTYAEFHGGNVTYVLGRLRPGNLGEGREAVAQLWGAFIETDDAQHAAPLVVGWIERFDAAGRDRDFLHAFMVGLQLYVGPLDIPTSDDAGEYKRAQAKLASWWDRNKRRPVACWLLDRLVSRGYDTGDPAAVERTALAIVSALKRGTTVERYAAAKVLADTLSGGDSIVAPRFPLFERGAMIPPYHEPTCQVILDEYLTTISLARAQRWYLVDSFTQKWNRSTANYR